MQSWTAKNLTYSPLRSCDDVSLPTTDRWDGLWVINFDPINSSARWPQPPSSECATQIFDDLKVYKSYMEPKALLDRGDKCFCNLLLTKTVPILEHLWPRPAAAGDWPHSSGMLGLILNYGWIKNHNSARSESIRPHKYGHTHVFTTSILRCKHIDKSDSS
jgi:hypothetical protein